MIARWAEDSKDRKKKFTFLQDDSPRDSDGKREFDPGGPMILSSWVESSANASDASLPNSLRVWAEGSKPVGGLHEEFALHSDSHDSVEGVGGGYLLRLDAHCGNAHLERQGL